MWYLTWVGIPLCVLTWLGTAALFFFISPFFGVLAFILAVILTESLLGAYRSQQSAVGNRK